MAVKDEVLETLQPTDFPLAVQGGQVCRANGAALFGPLPDEIAADIANRLNRDAAAREASGGDRPELQTGKIMLVGPNLGPYPADQGG